jgi:hypothetical protein
MGKIRKCNTIYLLQKPFRKNVRRIFGKPCGKNQSISSILGKTP